MKPASAQQASAKSGVVKRAVSVKASARQPKAARSAKAKTPVIASAVASPVEAQEPPLAADLLALLPAVQTGRVRCELGVEVQVEPVAQRLGYFDVRGKGFAYRMRPVATSTGALRLEDAQQGAVWLQLPHKSMLMNQRKGQRMADACVTSEQAALALAQRNAPSLLDAPPVGAVAVSGVSAAASNVNTSPESALTLLQGIAPPLVAVAAHNDAARPLPGDR
ncbi:MAG: hypothetical protein Fur007_01040 [Rhodoferax sp.]